MRVTTTVLFAALLLGGCTSDREKGLCPTAAVLTPASSLTVFRNGVPTDPAGELFTVWMSDVKTDCSFDKDNKTTDSSLRIIFNATRAPSNDAASYKVPYFVTVTQGGARVVAKKLFVVHFSFAAGATTTTLENKIDSTLIKFGRSGKVGEYEILIGFQLTQEQLDYNKKTGRYAP